MSRAPSNGGNCTIRVATRRRHADRMLLMVQTPHPPWRGGAAGVNCVPELPASQNISPIKPMSAIFRRGGLRCGRHAPAARRRTDGTGHHTYATGRRVGGIAALETHGRARPVSRASPNGGNCSIRAATRRRHAVGMLLMLQFPPAPRPGRASSTDARPLGPVDGGRAWPGFEIDHSERSSRVAISRAGRRPRARGGSVGGPRAARKVGGGRPRGSWAAGC